MSAPHSLAVTLPVLILDGHTIVILLEAAELAAIQPVHSTCSLHGATVADKGKLAVHAAPARQHLCVPHHLGATADRVQQERAGKRAAGQSVSM